MANTKRLALLLLCIECFGLTACQKQIEEFVGEGSKPPVEVQESFNKTLKISPGSVISEGTSVDGSFTITPTKRLVKGASVDASLTVNARTVE